MSENSFPSAGRQPPEVPKGNVSEAGATEKEPSPKVADAKPCEPAVFPEGFWKRVDYLLHHPEEILESIRRDVGLWHLTLTFLMIAVIMAAIYGAIMGATNLLQGSTMPFNAKLLMTLITAIKVPVLFLLTLAIVVPPIYVSNSFLGSRLAFRQMLALLMTGVTVTVTVLASMATVAFFFALTSGSYDFIKLLHVVFFAYAGAAGLAFVARCFEAVRSPGVRQTTRKLFIVWVVLYIFVGTQLAWVLRPFVGTPNEPFQVLRARKGNFYESVIDSARNLMKD